MEETLEKIKRCKEEREKYILLNKYRVLFNSLPDLNFAVNFFTEKFGEDDECVATIKTQIKETLDNLYTIKIQLAELGLEIVTDSNSNTIIEEDGLPRVKKIERMVNMDKEEHNENPGER